MKILPFPGRRESGPNDALHIELEAALDGEGEGPAAEAWRELRDDVRALAPPMTPAFERQLRERLPERKAQRRPRAAAAILVATAGVLVAAVMIAVPWRAATPREAVHASAGQRTPPTSAGANGAAGASTAEGTSRAAEALSGTSNGPNSAPARGNAAPNGASSAPVPALSAPAAAVPASAAVTPTPERVQQLAASISLATTPEGVQEIANRVARLAGSDGGFVQSSHVQVQQAGTSEANLMLRLPSARLSAALASLAGLASVHAESQSLQDITNAYDAARRRVADASAERQALLRALSRATTEGQIDSLRERLSQARGALAQARSALGAISQRASTAEVEVTVLGDARAVSEGLTLHRGLHDAGRVLVMTLVVLLIAAAILVPLALLLLALLSARRAWHRYARERALDAP
jgi:Domain of unknown function (DUF4349)